MSRDDSSSSTGTDASASPTTSADASEGARANAGATQPSTGAPYVLGAVTGRLRGDPGLWLPFFLAGCLALAADLLRERDPLPVASVVEESTFHVPFPIYPTGTFATERPLGALVDLQPAWLGYALGLETAVVAAIVVAGWATMLRASDAPFRPRRFLAYGAGVLCLRVTAAIGYEYDTGSLLLGLALLAGLLFAVVRLFLVPIALLREGGILRSVRTSWRYSRGNGAAIAGIVLAVGIASWLLARVPLAGSLLSATVAGTVHAVALVVVYERCAGD